MTPVSYSKQLLQKGAERWLDEPIIIMAQVSLCRTFIKSDFVWLLLQPTCEKTQLMSLHLSPASVRQTASWHSRKKNCLPRVCVSFKKSGICFLFCFASRTISHFSLLKPSQNGKPPACALTCYPWRASWLRQEQKDANIDVGHLPK